MRKDISLMLPALQKAVRLNTDNPHHLAYLTQAKKWYLYEKRESGRSRRVDPRRERCSYYHDKTHRNPFPNESDYPRGGTRWTNILLHVLACLHSVEREYWKWQLDESCESAPEGPDFSRADAIAEECRTHPSNVSKMLNKLARHGYVERLRDGRRVSWRITDRGVNLLWTAIYCRTSRRNIHGPDKWVSMPDVLSRYEFDALAMVRELIRRGHQLISGSVRVNRMLETSIRNTKRGPVMVRRWVIEAVNPGAYSYAVAKTPYCWKPSLAWRILRAVPLRVIESVIESTERKMESDWLDAQGRKIDSFFAWTASILLPKLEHVEKRWAWRKKLFSTERRHLQRLEGVLAHARQSGDRTLAREVELAVRGLPARRQASMAIGMCYQR